jgi:hypothetical protein
MEAMLGRLLIGIVKGLIVGGLVGFGLAKLGFAAPGAIVASVAAAVTGVLIGLVAGKPIWAKDARIEAGMKAFVGALLGAGLMYAARRWLSMPVPLELPELGAGAGTFGGLAITSLAAIAAILGGFYEADNTPTEGAASSEAPAKELPAAKNKRIDASALDAELEDEDEAEADKKRSKK